MLPKISNAYINYIYNIIGIAYITFVYRLLCKFVPVMLPKFLMPVFYYVCAPLCRSDVWARRAARQDLFGAKGIVKRRTLTICSEHFKPEDYYCPAQRATSNLLPTAVPSMNMYQSSSQTILTPRRPPLQRIISTPTTATTSMPLEVELETSSRRGAGRPKKTRATLLKESKDIRCKLSMQRQEIAVLRNSLRLLH